MKLRLSGAALTAALLASAAIPASADPVFNRIAVFAVNENLPADMDAASATSAEIITATEDGNMLVYSDSPLEAVGFIDIADPRAPKAAGTIKLEGEPTSVAVSGAKAFVGVNTSESFTAPSGFLGVIDIASKTLEAQCDLGGQPDSVAVSPDGSIVAVAIENERDEDLNDGEIPQMPAGDLVIISLKDGVADCATTKHVAMTGFEELTAPSDPEPEFIDINDENEIVVTMQENNGIAIVDGNTGAVKAHFSAGTVDLTGIDTEKGGKLDFTGSLNDVPREPDTVKWLDNDRFVIANEGDYKGGSRGFSIFSDTGELLHEAGASFERAVASIGHFPDKRAGKKGVEPEGLIVGQYGDTNYLFVMSERGSVVGVYNDNVQDAPELVQLLPSGIGPESGVAIPARNLLVTANEEDLGPDGGVRAHVMLYAYEEGEADYPQIASDVSRDPLIGFGALSGLAADPADASKLYAVNDSFYSGQPSVFIIDASKKPALITDAIRVTRNGEPAEKLDLEGVAVDGNGGFWLASEGNPDKDVPHAVLHIDGTGEITETIDLPEELLANQTRFGMEGITTVGEGDDLTLWMAVQREWADDAKGFVKLLAYTPATGAWGAVSYPLETPEKGWMGLSEITANGENVYIVERDNQIGAAAKVKKLFKVSLADMKPAAIGSELPVVEKQEVVDLLPLMKSATNGYVVDKIEGFTIAADGTAYAVTDNDGVDDSSGETLFFTVPMKM
ncbi:esterase-like activity of phytase family protein [Martelella lutilitoris]|uniref:Esterase-like activity of phytase family protein n=1 Tax=Martelella lutilitoris TaxID=2583532 RepID=A0A7T7HN82_9HYPH|nr:esterase-like activity of phytase family protein [Martelella lutilitoris]QQM32319.1 esterase-like activity of phytase family protein [Martelella lutilitoris]